MVAKDLLDTLATVDTPTLSNAIEGLDVRNRASGFASSRLRCMTPDLGILCGYAVTATSVTASPEPKDRNLALESMVAVCEALQALPGPGVVVIQEVGPHREFAATCGDVMATLFHRFGGVGVVTDAGVRDIDGIRHVPFLAFATGMVASHGNLRICGVGAPVTIEGLIIRPGDLLHGDVSGLIAIPTEGAERLPELAEKVHKREGAIIDAIAKERASLEQIIERMR